jgi:hypothetical protein
VLPGTPFGGSGGAVGAGRAAWGGITGTPSAQTDLQTALDGKEAAGTFSGIGACAANQWASTLNDGAAPTCTQPAFSNLSGAVTDAQVPNTITIDLAAAATALAADPVNCSDATHFAVGVAASGTATCEAIADADVPNDITIDLATTAVTANAGDSATAFFSAGAIEVARGGTGAAPGADDEVLVSDSASAATWRAVPDCVDTSGNHLNYTASTNTFSCGTSGGAGGGCRAHPDRRKLGRRRCRHHVAAADGQLRRECHHDAGDLHDHHGDVGAGTWRFKDTIIAQSSVTTTGFKFAVNHTDTTGAFGSRWTQVSLIGTTTDGIADSITSLAIGGAVAGYAERVKNTATIASVGVDVVNSNVMILLEGLVVVTVSGSLELRYASEMANSTQVMADTVLELNKIG